MYKNSFKKDSDLIDRGIIPLAMFAGQDNVATSG